LPEVVPLGNLFISVEVLEMFLNSFSRISTETAAVGQSFF